MVSHETVSVQGAAFFNEQSAQLMDKERSIRILTEAGSAIVPTLNGVN